MTAIHKGTRRSLVALALTLFTALAAWPQNQPQDLPAATLRVGMHNIRAQLALTPQQRQIGLMFRQSMPNHEGMLFVFDEAGSQCFWMRNTLIPLSAAFLAASIKDPHVKGLVLTTSLGDAGRGRNRAVTVYDAPLKRITMPVLVVHHQQDACWASPFGAATGIPAALSGSVKVDFVAVSGGDPPRSEPCETFAAHGFVGRELLVVGVIADWIAGKPVPTQLP